MRGEAVPGRRRIDGSPAGRRRRSRTIRGLVMTGVALILFAVTAAVSVSGWALVVGTAAFALGTAGIATIFFESGGDGLADHRQ